MFAPVLGLEIINLFDGVGGVMGWLTITRNATIVFSFSEMDQCKGVSIYLRLSAAGNRK